MRIGFAFVALLAILLPAHKWSLGRNIEPSAPVIHDGRGRGDIAQSAKPPRVPMVAQLQGPDEAEFLEIYQHDRSDREVQTWQAYWGWIQTFYNGNLLSEGWMRFGQVTGDVVKSERERSSVIERLNDLGKLISQEWAKSGGIRKITTADLKRWNDAISRARSKDDGTGERILNALQKVRELVETRVHRERVRESAE